MLRTALGPAIATWLEDPSVVEVMLNPDGRLWIDRLAVRSSLVAKHTRTWQLSKMALLGP